MPRRNSDGLNPQLRARFSLELCARKSTMFVSNVNLRGFGNRLDGQWRCRHKANAPQTSRSQTTDTSASSGRVGRAKF